MTLAAHEEVVDAEIVRTWGEWAGIIKGDLGQAVEGIVSAGKHLTSAKADVNHGEWQDMLDEIGISRAWAAKLMQIGRNPALANVNQGLHLPASIKALYELAKLDPSDIEDGIESGRITPNMKIKDAKAFASNDSALENPDASFEFGDDQVKPIVTPSGHTIRSGENEYTDAANGIRNDVQARTNMLLDYLGAVGKNLPGDCLPDYANDHVIQALKNNMEDVQNAFEWTLSQIKRN